MWIKNNRKVSQSCFFLYIYFISFTEYFYADIFFRYMCLDSQFEIQLQVKKAAESRITQETKASLLCPYQHGVFRLLLYLHFSRPTQIY